MSIKIILEDGVIMPTRGTPRSSGYDLYAPHDMRIPAGRVVVIHSGVSIELHPGMEGQIRGRSSMNKRGLVVLLGTIDSDYRGVIGATILNITDESQIIKQGDRFAQLVMCRISMEDLVVADELSPTERGTGGFGSTGK